MLHYTLAASDRGVHSLPCAAVSPCPTDALSFSSTPDLSSAAESAKDTASDLKSKAKSALKGNSALPNSVGTVADLNKDVRGEAGDYRDPAAAIQQDTAAGGLPVCTDLRKSGSFCPAHAHSAPAHCPDFSPPRLFLLMLPLLPPPGAADKVVSSATSATKALPTKGLSTPSVPKPVKKAFTPPSRPKKDIGVGAGETDTGALARAGR
jgi:hypothetical protein